MTACQTSRMRKATGSGHHTHPQQARRHLCLQRVWHARRVCATRQLTGLHHRQMQDRTRIQDERASGTHKVTTGRRVSRRCILRRAMMNQKQMCLELGADHHPDHRHETNRFETMQLLAHLPQLDSMLLLISKVGAMRPSI